MQTKHIIPAILIALDICCAVVYLWKGEPWRCCYWLSAAAISFSAIKM